MPEKNEIEVPEIRAKIVDLIEEHFSDARPMQVIAALLRAGDEYLALERELSGRTGR